MTKELRLMQWPVRLPSSYFTGFLMINHPPVEGACEFGWGKPFEERDDKFLAALCDYFEKRMKSESLDAGSQEWDAIVPTHREFVELLRERDYEKLHTYLRYMWSQPLCHGTAQGRYFFERLRKNLDDIQNNTGFAIYDKFLSLMESRGIIPVFSPEEYLQKNDFLKFYTISPDKYLEWLEDSLDCKLQAPKFQGNHFGIVTEEHGLFSDRDIMALGIAIHIEEAYGRRKDITICDIGGGVGYLAYWLKQLGFKNITYVDLPTVTVSAKYFLETNGVTGINFISPNEFDGKYDVVINFDGITTYGKEAAENYTSKIAKNAGHFISINREIDEFRVSDITDMRRISRNQFWLRKGYIEEDYVPEKS